MARPRRVNFRISVTTNYSSSALLSQPLLILPVRRYCSTAEYVRESAVRDDLSALDRAGDVVVVEQSRVRRQWGLARGVDLSVRADRDRRRERLGRSDNVGARERGRALHDLVEH